MDDAVALTVVVETVVCAVVWWLAAILVLEHVVEYKVERGDTEVVVTVIAKGTWTVVIPSPRT